MPRPRPHWLVLPLLIAATFGPRPAGSITLPPGFVAESVVSGALFTVPTTIALLPDGRMLVGEKSGRVWVVKSGVRHPLPVWDGEDEVLDSVDRGLLSIAVDPDFATNRRLYFLYTVDPDSDGVDNNDDAFGRLTRYTMSATDSNAVDPASRAVLMGVDWPSGPPVGSQSHTIAALRFGRDGSLLVSIGDGAHFGDPDAGGQDPDLFLPGRTDPYQDIGAFRSQSLVSLAGKVLRLDPETGHGYPGNPFWDGDPMSVRSRVWVYGLRNPFRFALVPGTGSAVPADDDPGTLVIGDVGWLTWEELNVAASGGLNFGWPCYEGMVAQPAYQAASPSHGGCDSIGTPSNPVTPSPPLSAYNRDDPDIGTPPGFTGSTIVGGTFATNPTWPAPYRDHFFFADFAEDWIHVLTSDSLNAPPGVAEFAEGAEGAVDMARDPLTGDLFVVSLISGDVRRIRWTGPGGDTPPVALANATPDSGAAPLVVAFSGAASSDADGDTLDYLWLFGDGSTATGVSAAHAYPLPGAYDAVLVVDDRRGGIARDTLAIRVTADYAFPTTALLDRFDRPDGLLGPLWLGDTAGIGIESQAAVPAGLASWALYGLTSFGPLQEAYWRVDLVTPLAQSHALLLKAQAASPESAHIEVRHDGFGNRVLVSTKTPGQPLAVQGAPIPLVLQDGDQLGARVYPNGIVEVFLNQALVGSRSVAGWPWVAAGGRAGMAFRGAYVSRIEDFGGGNASVTGNRPPLALIAAPAETSWYAPGDTIRLDGDGLDPNDPPASLAYHWSVMQRRDNFVSSVLQADAPDTAFVATATGEGLNTLYYDARLIVSDPGALASDALVRVFPECDLAADAPDVTPTQPVTGQDAVFAFWIHNTGRMRTRPVRWRLTLDGATLAEADTVVAARDSVHVTRVIAIAAGAGAHELRATADTLGAVVEPDETNNGTTRTVQVVLPNTAVETRAERLALSIARPNPARGAVSFALELPAPAEVGFAVLDVQGREVWSEPGRPLPAGTHALRWDGRDRAGNPPPPGLYLARVRVAGAILTRRFALIR